MGYGHFYQSQWELLCVFYPHRIVNRQSMKRHLINEHGKFHIRQLLYEFEEKHYLGQKRIDYFMVTK